MAEGALGVDARPSALESERPGGIFLFAEHLMLTLSALDILDNAFEAARIEELPAAYVLDRHLHHSVTVNIHGEPYRLRQYSQGRPRPQTNRERR